MKPWNAFALEIPPKGGFGSGSWLRSVMHVTHTAAALRIIEDGHISRGLIHDESSLNAYRTTVTWLSPNRWVWGSRYGNVEFSFDFDRLVANRTVYWVESIAYRPPACRFLITDRDVSALPVTFYDPLVAHGPLRLVDGRWWWNSEITLEFMLDDDLRLADCQKLDFIKHHPNMCAIDHHSCADLGRGGDRAAARVVAGVLAGRRHVLDGLLVNTGRTDTSPAMDEGLCAIPRLLDVLDDDLTGALSKRSSVDAALRAALLQLSTGDSDGAAATAALLGSYGSLNAALVRICEEHLGVTPTVLGWSG